MESTSFFAQMLQHAKEQQQSEIYQSYHKLLDQESFRLYGVMQRFLLQLESIRASCLGQTIRQEMAVQCRYLHRGFYCPSPVFDLIVGNSRRGRILKKPSKRSSPAFTYGFDSNGKLQWSRDHLTNTYEYLIYEDEKIYGLSVGEDSNYCTLSEETYQGKKLVSFYVVHYYDMLPRPCIMDAEIYQYDEEGLSDVLRFDFRPYSEKSVSFLPEEVNEFLPLCDLHCLGRYRFQKENGMLSNYQVYDLVSGKPKHGVYTVQECRRA